LPSGGSQGAVGECDGPMTARWEPRAVAIRGSVNDAATLCSLYLALVPRLRRLEKQLVPRAACSVRRDCTVNQSRGEPAQVGSRFAYNAVTCCSCCRSPARRTRLLAATAGAASVIHRRKLRIGYRRCFCSDVSPILHGGWADEPVTAAPECLDPALAARFVAEHPGAALQPGLSSFSSTARPSPPP
jgi:hypothetical protein